MTKSFKRTSCCTKILFSAFLFAVSLSLYGQNSNTAATIFKIDSLLNISDYAGAQRLALDQLYQENLTDRERFEFWMIRAEIIRASGQPLEAAEAYQKARSYVPATENMKVFISLIQMKLGECYFDIPDYDQAAIHASKSLEISPDSSLAEAGHTVNYLILGYVDFLNEKYKNALSYYQNAMDNYKSRGLICDLPLVYTKMARVVNAMGSPKEAMGYIDESKTINKSCNIKTYDILIYETLYEIYEENEEYQEALKTLEYIGQIRNEINYERQSAEMALLEKEYESDLKKSEIEALRQVNIKNEVITKQQSRILWIALVGIISLLILSILLANSNKRRKSALTKLGQLNRTLEKEVSKRTAHLREANENIRSQTESIAERNAALTDLYHMVSHNLRGPINNLSSLVDFIKHEEDPKERTMLIETMDPVLENLKNTANELLEKVNLSSRIDNDSKTVSFEDCFNLAKKGLKVEVESTKAKITTDFQQAESVHYSPKYLTSIFYNLLSNSLKYRSSERNPSISISTSKDDKGILLEFKDNGIGMDLDKDGHRLFQYEGTLKDHPDATGIGLYMLKTQITRAGGEIWAESALGVGTNLFVRFST